VAERVVVVAQVAVAVVVEAEAVGVVEGLQRYLISLMALQHGQSIWSISIFS
jgi:hypothetical protein